MIVQINSILPIWLKTIKLIKTINLIKNNQFNKNKIDWVFVQNGLFFWSGFFPQEKKYHFPHLDKRKRKRENRFKIVVVWSVCSIEVVLDIC